MYTMLYLVVSCFGPISTSRWTDVRTFDQLGVFLSVLPSVPLHLARRPAAAPSHPVHPHHDVLLHRPVPGVRPQAPSHRRAGGVHPGRPGGLLHSEWTLRPGAPTDLMAPNSSRRLSLRGLHFSSFFCFFSGFLRVGFIQDQRETLDSGADAGEERPRSPCGHQGAQQPSHHGIVATVTRSRADPDRNRSHRSKLDPSSTL